MSTYGYIYRPYKGDTRDTIRLPEHSVQRRINELRSKLSAEKPDVFVSHKNEDMDTAEKVAETIANCGLKVYLDTLDTNIRGDDSELVDYIQSIIEYCNSLIAVVSHSTVHSWWVPLEIGIAITKDLYLGTFLVSPYPKRNFPSYLWKWPVLRGMDDLEDWCEERNRTTSTKRLYESLKRNHPNMFRQ